MSVVVRLLLDFRICNVSGKVGDGTETTCRLILDSNKRGKAGQKIVLQEWTHFSDT